MMKKFNLKELVSTLEEDHRELGFADNVEIHYKGNFLPIKINGVVREELKVFKGSFCIYGLEERALDEYDLDVELLVLEEYSDSPYSIYINEDGVVDGDEFGEVFAIEIGNSIALKVEDGFVTHHEVKIPK